MKNALQANRCTVELNKVVIGTLICIVLSTKIQVSSAQSVAINNDGSSADASAAVDIKSTSKGMLVPRMTTAQRTAIASPATGLLVYDITTDSFWFKDAGAWIELVDKSNEKWQYAPNATDIFRNSKVGVFTTPTLPLEINGQNFYANGAVMKIKNPVSSVGAKSTLLLSTNDLTGADGTQGCAAISSITSVNGGQHLSFTTVPSSTQTLTVYERMRIDSAGNVGIGNTSPVEKLDVTGNIKLSGSIMKPGFGNLNFVPYAYGRVSAGGIVFGTQNFTISHPGTGNYWINFGSAAGLNSSNSLIVITPESSQNDNISVSYDQTFNDNIFIINVSHASLSKVQCNQGNVACPSVIFDVGLTSAPINKGFSFVVYKFQF